MVTNETKTTGNVKIDPLPVNTETLQDLSDEAQQSIIGGRVAATVDRPIAEINRAAPSSGCVITIHCDPTAFNCPK